MKVFSIKTPPAILDDIIVPELQAETLTYSFLDSYLFYKSAK